MLQLQHRNEVLNHTVASLQQQLQRYDWQTRVSASQSSFTVKVAGWVTCLTLPGVRHCPRAVVPVRSKTL
jgi:hypothetical protein